MRYFSELIVVSVRPSDSDTMTVTAVEAIASSSGKNGRTSNYWRLTSRVCDMETGKVLLPVTQKTLKSYVVASKCMHELQCSPATVYNTPVHVKLYSLTLIRPVFF